MQPTDTTGQSWPFTGLRPLSYGVIMADPPWRFDLRSAAGEEKSPQAQYACMPLDEIKALPVAQLAARDCLLWLWATFPMLPQAIDTMSAWGFRYVTGGAWHKKTVHGKTAFGTGYVMRSAAEPFPIGKIGAPSVVSKSERNLIEAEVREHSRKPDQAYDVVERLCPKVLCCELFARQLLLRPHWFHWGNQADKFGSAA
ncbi:MT-A70 family methyltransferase [Ferrovibrio terrae]|uniref:MT-A70 family methyltransferase n=1 Tax=Ferrovibrio terrae TaxID=2594003 RepID=UPI0031383BE2